MWTKIVIAILASLPPFLYGGWVTMLFWEWFITPFGADPISYGLALGINLFVSRMTFNASEDAPNHVEGIISNMMTALIVLTMLLAVGKITHWLFL